MRVKQIGVVEILIDRTYHLDATCPHIFATEVLVRPGGFPLLQTNTGEILWLMDGEINAKFWRHGDGLISAHDGDVYSGIEVRFPSRIYSRKEFLSLMEDNICQPGPNQRLKISLYESIVV